MTLLADAVVEEPAHGAIGVRVGVLCWWHLLSLDAPTVAAVWMWFVARTFGLVLRWTEVTAMFVAVWVVYAGDRLLDARLFDVGSNAAGLEERHRFHYRHRVWFCAGIAGASLLLAALLSTMLMTELKLYAALGLLLLCWFAAIHLSGRVLPKELVLGGFFAGAIFAPVLARTTAHVGEVLVAAACFGALCSLNSCFLSAWEEQYGQGVEGHRSVRFIARHLVQATYLLALTALCLEWRLASWIGMIALAVVTSCGLLLVLQELRGRLDGMTLRACADLALLTPLALRMWLR